MTPHRWATATLGAVLACTALGYGITQITSTEPSDEPLPATLRALPPTPETYTGFRYTHTPMPPMVPADAARFEVTTSSPLPLTTRTIPDAAATPRSSDTAAAAPVVAANSSQWRDELYADRGADLPGDPSVRPVGIDGELLQTCLDSIGDTEVGQQICLGTAITTP